MTDQQKTFLASRFPDAEIVGDDFRLDFDEGPEGANDPKAQDLYHEVCDALNEQGLQFVEPYIEHDCISGKITAAAPKDFPLLLNLTVRQFCERKRPDDDLPSLYDVLWVHFTARPDDALTPEVWIFLDSLP